MINKVSSVNQSQYPKTNGKQNIAFEKRFFLVTPNKTCPILMSNNEKKEITLVEYLGRFITRALGDKQEVHMAKEKGEFNKKLTFFESDDIENNTRALGILTAEDSLEASSIKTEEDFLNFINKEDAKNIYINMDEQTPKGNLINFIRENLFPVFGVKDEKVLINKTPDGTKVYYKDTDVKNICSN